MAKEDPKDGALTYEEAIEEFGDYWVLKDPFNWDYVPPRALSPKARLPILVRGMAIGVTQGQIAKRCGVTRRTLYTDRSSVDSIKLAEELLILQLEDIGKLARFPDPKALTLAMNFRDRLIQKFIPRKVITETKGHLEAEVKVDIPELSDEDFARFVPVIVKVALGQEARELNEDDDHEDPQEPVG